MLALKLCVFTAVLVLAFGGCKKQNRIKLRHGSDDFDFSVNGDGSDTSALGGSGTAYSDNGPVYIMIKGTKGVFRNFDWKRLCFQVKGAMSIDVVYEGRITDPMCDKDGCYAVGPPLSREMPRPLNPSKYQKICLKNKHTMSKISIDLKAAPGGAIMVRKMAMGACIVD